MAEKRGRAALIAAAAAMGAAVLMLCAGCGNAPAVPEPTAAPEPEIAVTDSENGSIRISEVMIKNKAVFYEPETGEFPDYIELENCSDHTVELCGWSLTDGDKPGWIIPDTQLAPGQLLLIEADKKDFCGERIHADFSLSAGETLRLFDSVGDPADSFVCPDTAGNISVMLTENGFEETLYPTPGYPNDRAGYRAWQETLAPAGPLVISEAMTSNRTYPYQPGGECCDWVEIKNISAQSVMMSDYYLSDSDDDFLRWQLPAAELGAGECMTVICSGVGGEYSGGIAFAPFKLNASDEQLYLSTNDRVIDSAWFRDIPYNCSFGRSDGQNGFFFFPSPTLNAPNGEGFRSVAAKPEALTPDGCCGDVPSVTVELSGSGLIRYTTDGSYPGADSAVYSGPFELTETTVVRAVCTNEGELVSPCLDLTYVLGQEYTLPLVSIVTNSEGEFNAMYNNANKWLEILGSISYHGEDGGFNAACGVTLSGATSLALPKKNISVKIRGCYGDGPLEYDLFGGGVTEFHALTLRAGQDHYGAIIRDELCEALCLQATDNVPTQRWKYCVLYVNGRYYGVYALKEKINADYYALLEGGSSEQVQISLPTSSYYDEYYQQIVQYVYDHDMADEAAYEEYCRFVDVDSLIDWALLEGYIGNYDLQSGNLRYAKCGDGKWKFVFYDLDCALRESDSIFGNLFSNYSQSKQIATVLKRLLRNESFRTKMIERYAYLTQTVLNDEHMLSEIDRIYAEIEPDIYADRDKWYYRDSYEFAKKDLRMKFEEQGWSETALELFCYYLDITAEEKEAYFG